MENLGDILRNDMLARSMNPALTPPGNLSSGTDPQARCPGCNGHRFTVSSERLPNDAVHLLPCRLCNTPVRDDRDWFAPLRAEHQKRGNVQAIKLAEKMAQKPAGWLVLHGPIGTGKTALAAAIESTWWGKARIPRTVATWLEMWQGWVMEDDFGVRFRRDCDSTMVVLDNLGRERLTAWKLDRLTEFLDWRYVRHLPTVITTEYDVDQLARRLGDHAGDGDAIADRVFSTETDLVTVVTLKGRSFRTGKAW